MRKVLFIDRDGTLIREPADYQIDGFEKLQFMPGIFRNLSELAKQTDYEFVMVSNQDGLGTSSFPEDDFWPVQNFIINSLQSEGIHFEDILIDRSLPSEHSPNRKPGIGMMNKYTTGKYNLKESIVIGDRETDLQFAKNLGSKCILLGKSEFRPSDTSLLFQAAHWDEISKGILLPIRTADIKRKTNETEIEIALCLDGSGQSEIQTGLGFFDHMLEQIARHSLINLSIKAKGDLHVDEHHTIEDTGIALGEAFTKALGEKRGIERYGFSLPMDDCLAQVALDFGGRPWIVWDVSFKREKIGDVPTEMFFHFFKSFSDASRCNLNIKSEGINEHHKIESIFKAFAKCIKMAVKREGYLMPTTKGTL
ncbi:MAG: bifunctional histidinol-phosphatase/imidazoleglycerol-phosphate dehydratase HisB [Flammeovirgaceae bacterium]|nr:bifunctional histidinol-phosphatase/imidazoleglycerol-phosphate dehydratase HisB [Flammeovirgaceae bacterium]